jgi:hypothetical protein
MVSAGDRLRAVWAVNRENGAAEIIEVVDGFGGGHDGGAACWVEMLDGTGSKIIPRLGGGVGVTVTTTASFTDTGPLPSLKSAWTETVILVEGSCPGVMVADNPSAET